MCGPEDPLFTPLLPLARVPFQAKESVHKTPFWENLEILASTASIFTQILAHKPPNLEIFSSQAPKFGNFPLTSPPFQRQMSVRKPHTSDIRAAHPYLKKSWVPPPPGLGFKKPSDYGEVPYVRPEDMLYRALLCMTSAKSGGGKTNELLFKSWVCGG